MFNNDTNYLDQHFLIDNKVIDDFINEVDPKIDDVIVEIGPGKGVITSKILPYVNNYTVIEKDSNLIPFLSEFNGINIINANVLDIEIPKCNKIITSLPYSIIEPFIYKLIDTKFDKLIMICGNNYALNVLNKSNNKLSLLTNMFFKMNYIEEIKPSSFNPEPRVLSSLITLEPLDESILNKNELIIRNLFLYRYMKLKNALKEILIKLNNITQNEAKDIINKYNIEDNILNKKFDDLSNFEVNYLINIINKENI